MNIIQDYRKGKRDLSSSHSQARKALTMTRSPLLPAFIGFAVTGAIMLAVSPAFAETAAADYRCGALAEQARTAAATTSDPAQRERASRFVATGDRLCAARSEGPAARQFRSALRILNVAEARTGDAQLATAH
jgi:hypothetical protein